MHTNLDFLTEFISPEKADLLDLLIKYSPAAIAIFDREMRYIAASDRWVKDYGLKCEDIVGVSHYELFPEILNMPKWVEGHRSTLQDGEIDASDCDTFPREDGSIDYVRFENRPWYKEDGSIGGLVMFTEVITDEVETRMQMERQARFLQRASQIAKIGYWHINLKNENITWSDEIYKIHGYPPQSFKPTLQLGLDAYHPDDREKVEKYIQDAVEEKKNFNFSLRIIRPNGSERKVLSIGECEFNDQGDITGIFGIFKDQTEE